MFLYWIYSATKLHKSSRKPIEFQNQNILLDACGHEAVTKTRLEMVNVNINLVDDEECSVMEPKEQLIIDIK